MIPIGLPTATASALGLASSNRTMITERATSAAATRKVQDPRGFSSAVLATTEPTIGIQGGFEAGGGLKQYIPMLLIGAIIFYLIFKA